MKFIKKYNFKVKKNFFTVLLFALILTAIYYFVNFFGNNILLESIADNLIIQTFFIFIFFTGVINIFFPFTIKEDIKKEDIKKVAKDVVKKTHKEIVEFEEYRNDTL